MSGFQSFKMFLLAMGRLACSAQPSSLAASEQGGHSGALPFGQLAEVSLSQWPMGEACPSPLAETPAGLETLACLRLDFPGDIGEMWAAGYCPPIGFEHLQEKG